MSPNLQEHVAALDRLRELLDNPYALLTGNEVKQLGRCSLQHVYDLVAEGVLRGPVGRPVRIYAASVKEWLYGADTAEGEEPPAPDEPTAPKPDPTMPGPSQRPVRARAGSRVVLPYPGQIHRATP
jgi:hypothetical protein